MKQMIEIPSIKSIETSYTQLDNTAQWNLSRISAPHCTLVTWSDFWLTIGWIGGFWCSEFSTIFGYGSDMVGFKVDKQNKDMNKILKK